MDPIEAVGQKIDYGTPIQRKKKAVRPSYMQREVDLSKTPILFFPPGKEMLFFGIYFAILPYITGLLFVFFYVARGKAAIFGSLNVGLDSSVFILWMIGYEILAVIIVLWIIKNAIMYSIKSSQATKKQPHSNQKRYKRY